MAKNTNRVARVIAYVAALGLATGAWAAHWDLNVKNPVTYAQELFGGDNPDDLDLTLSKDNTATAAPMNEQTRVELQLFLPNGGITGGTDPAARNVDANSELEITLTLANATFGQAVSWTDITTASEGALRKVNGSQKGGNAGTNSVTFKISANAEIASSTAPSGGGAVPNQVVTVNLGSLEDASALKGAKSVTVSGKSTVTGGPTNNFPTMIATRGVRCVDLNVSTGDSPNTVTCAGKTASINEEIRIEPALSAKVADSAVGVTFAATNGAGGVIDIKDRKKLGAKKTKIPLGSLAITKGTAKDAGGAKTFAEGAGANANITVTVSGMVRAGDDIYYNANDNAKKDAKEDLTITGGAASRTFRLENVKTGANVYFAPNGTHDMTKGMFTTNFAIEYDSTTATSPGTKKATAPLNYEGVSTQAKAYAIPNPGMNDIGNVRIKCDAGGEATCTVFLDCNEQDGTAHFGELGSTVAAGATTVLQAEAVADVLGVDSWNGRLSCEVLSNNDASAQVLVRSGDSLINNTYVSDE